MGKQVTVDGEQVTVDEDTSVEELKNAFGAADSDIATYRDGNQLKALSDQDTVDEVPDDGTISFQPAEGEIFG